MMCLRILYKAGKIDKVFDDTLIVSSHEMTLQQIADHIEDMTNHYHKRLHFLNERQGVMLDGKLPGALKDNND